ncbi:MAG: MscL family protein [Bacillota bacterium]|nr:MscL family protein [Bacillota bacterium]
MSGFIDFIRKQGVVGLAIGFILGGAVSKVVAALVEDIINPLIGLLLGNAAGLTSAVFEIGPAKIKWGHLFSVVIDFAAVAVVVYFGFRKLGLDRLDKKA